MSSLWTPDGEHRVPRDGAPPDPKATSESPGPRADPGALLDPTPGGEPSEDEMRMLASELLAAPVTDVIANHCYGLFELAALHLSQQPPDLEAARAAIDAMGFVVDGLGPRLGQHAATLAEGLGQVRLAWVKIADTSTGRQTDRQGPPGTSGKDGQQ
ncbi:MAG: hypothetical protein ACYCSF_10710 [Acidimicrobiales bacterium]